MPTRRRRVPSTAERFVQVLGVLRPETRFAGLDILKKEPLSSRRSRVTCNLGWAAFSYDILTTTRVDYIENILGLLEITKTT